MRATAIPKVVVSIAILFLLIGPAAFGTQALLVPSQYPTIAEAIAAASPGAIIYVSPGVYVENLVIEIPLSLIGVGGGDEPVQIEGERASDPVIEVRIAERQGALIQQLLLVTEGSGACILLDSAVAASVTVRRCNLDAMGGYETNCIDVMRGSLVVTESAFVGPNKALARLDRSNGVFVGGGASAVIRDCTFTDFEDSVQTQGGERLIVEQCRIRHSIGGITIWNAAWHDTEAMFDRNTIVDCVAGISLTGHAASVTISSNTIRESHWLPFRLALTVCPGTEDGTPFTGELSGRGNTVDVPELLCPAIDAPYWPVGFFR